LSIEPAQFDLFSKKLIELSQSNFFSRKNLSEFLDKRRNSLFGTCKKPQKMPNSRGNQIGPGQAAITRSI